MEGRVTTPLLLVGEEGVGRRFSVMESIKEMIALHRGASSSEIVQVEHGVHPDVMVVTAPVDKEIGVDPIRDLVAQSLSYPSSAPCRFFVVDGADRMTMPAANAILKTLEEPPAASRFFLLAESYDRVLPTIRSRCGRIPYRKLPETFIVERIAKFESDPDKALVYARMGEGSVGRAARYWGSNRIVIRDHVLGILQSSAIGDLPAAFSIVDQLAKELPLTLRFLCFLAHDALVVQLDPRRVINQDILDDVAAMKNRTKNETWLRLWSGLRIVWSRYESSYVNLGFQVKTALVNAFAGG